MNVHLAHILAALCRKTLGVSTSGPRRDRVNRHLKTQAQEDAERGLYTHSSLGGCVDVYIKQVYLLPMTWTVNFSRRVAKTLGGKKRPPEAVLSALKALVRDIEEYGPVRGNWKNYSRLGPTRHHCHLKAGKPTYVAVWEAVQGGIQLVEVEYVGTHEKAPY